MSYGLNKWMGIGNVGKEPEFKTVTVKGEDRSLVKFSIATPAEFKNSEGGRDTDWHNCEVWGKLAEIIRDYVHKGSKIYVEGSVAYDQWTDDNGNKRTATKMKITNCVLLDPKGQRDTSEYDQTPAHEKVYADPPQSHRKNDEDLPF
jgi:single-strand DNA-binding protein